MAGRINGQMLTVNRVTTATDELGAVYKDLNGRVYRYIKSASVLAKGDVVGISSTTTASGAQGRGWRVSSATGFAKTGCGVAIAALSSSCYGWILESGPLGNFNDAVGNLYIKTNKSVAALDPCVKSAATAKMALKQNATGSQSAWVFAQAIGSDSGSFLVNGILISRFGGQS